MSKNPFFSIVIPTLNEENYLPKLLKDFTKQKPNNFEVIVVDGKSKDKTKEKALSFAKYFPFEYVESEKRNVSFQRNLGAKKAKGEYLVFMDADARISPVFAKNLYADIATKKDYLFLPTLTTEVRSSRNMVLFKLINSAIDLSQSLNKPLSAGGAIFIAKKLFEDLEGFRENLYMSEDHDLVQRARKLGVRAKVLKNVKVVFSMRRVNREGQAMVLYKYLLALIYMLANKEVKNKIFIYEMGGEKTKNLKLKEKWSLREDAAKLNKLIRKTSSFFKDSLS